MKRLRMISDGALGRLRQRATEAWHRRDYPEYFKIMEQANRQDPANSNILLDMGVACGMRYDYAAAERWFEKAIRVAPNRANALVMAGTQCRGFNRYEMAISYLDRAASEPNASPDTFVKLAELCERLRMADQASVWVERALNRDPQNALAALVSARLARLDKNLEAAESRLRALLARSDRDSWSTRVRGWYELGATLDSQGRYDEAMAAFLEAKSMILPGAAQYFPAQEVIHTKLKLMAQRLDRSKIVYWRSRAASLQSPQRLALLCGHPRSGTTLLEQVLDSHPGLVSAEETPIFQAETYLPLVRDIPADIPAFDALDAASPANLLQARNNYLGCMSRFLGHDFDGRILVDKNPSLTGLVPGFIRIFPEAKLLVALRDPRDVCLSCFMQPFPLGQGSASFLTLEGTFKEYAAVMGLWRAVSAVLDGGFLEIRYEDLVADLESASKRALAFLGLPWDDRVLAFHEHARKKLVRSPSYAAVSQPVSSSAIGRWRHYQKHLEPWLDGLAPLIKGFQYVN